MLNIGDVNDAYEFKVDNRWNSSKLINAINKDETQTIKSTMARITKRKKEIILIIIIYVVILHISVSSH